MTALFGDCDHEWRTWGITGVALGKNIRGDETVVRYEMTRSCRNGDCTETEKKYVIGATIEEWKSVNGSISICGEDVHGPVPESIIEDWRSVEDTRDGYEGRTERMSERHRDNIDEDRDYCPVCGDRCTGVGTYADATVASFVSETVCIEPVSEDRLRVFTHE